MKIFFSIKIVPLRLKSFVHREHDVMAL